MTKYVPIYSFKLSMDTYRQALYNKAIMKEVSPILETPRKEIVMAVSEAQKKASVKYLEKLDEIRIRMPKGKKELIKAHADAQGESVNGFINRAVDETMERDEAKE